MLTRLLDADAVLSPHTIPGYLYQFLKDALGSPGEEPNQAPHTFSTLETVAPVAGPTLKRRIPLWCNNLDAGGSIFGLQVNLSLTRTFGCV
jgi:hypothetical protein